MVACTAAADRGSTTPVNAGTSHVYPQLVCELHRGSPMMITGSPCKVVDICMSRTASNYRPAKAHIVAIDMFTGEKHEDIREASQSVEVPFTRFTEYQLLTADPATGEVSLLLDDGTIRDDLTLRTDFKEGSQGQQKTKEEQKLVEEIVASLEAGRTTIARVLSACGREKIVGVRSSD
mmetsp:Transcript_41378/g.66841  ORF Transcript_41378/g.66841 Transcript_41378/m.66841 type:complete len:178 (-) Transcript_41378:177-710(-)